MIWEKLGQIFEFEKSPFAARFSSHAQSPQTLVLEDRVRIFFSTRKTDETGIALSHIQYIDFDKDFKNMLGHSQDEVISLGGLGCYDEHGIFPLNIFAKDGKVYGYICGINRRVSVPIESSIGLATSSDNGATFSRYGEGPILTSSLHEPFLVCDPFVSHYDGKYHMWYSYGIRWIKDAEEDRAPSRVYKIGHATSQDGINWTKESKQIITDKLGVDECQALPTVFEHNGKYHMYFCYRQAVDFRKNSQNSYRLGYATSSDLEKWARDDKQAGIDISAEGWDSDMQCYPHVFRCGSEVYLLYNGNEFGRGGFGIARLAKD